MSVPLLWQSPAILVASLMPMTWGDAFAAIIGKRFGAHKYMVFGHTKSIEGSLAMFAFSFVAVTITFLIFYAPFITSMDIVLIILLVAAFIVALVATAVEAFSPFGLDNLTVPMVSAIVLVLINNSL